MKKYSTDYVGVFYRIGKRIGGKGDEKIFYVTYKKDGQKIETKVGRQFTDNMTASKANLLRSSYLEGKRLTRKEERTAKFYKENAEKDKPTISNLWREYKEANPHIKGIVTDENRFKNHIEPFFGKKRPEEILPLDIDRLRLKELKGKSPATIRNTLELLRRIINFGIKRNHCGGLSFKLELPEVYNETTEDLTPEQLQYLLNAIEEDENIEVGNMMKMALYTGMRRGELFKLKWKDIYFETGFIFLKDPKGGPDQKIPMNDMAKTLLKNVARTKSPYVFPGRNGEKRSDIGKGAKNIKKGRITKKL